MERSLRVNESNGFDCASSGRLWEDLLNKHRLPYLLIRVADMRMSLDSKVTAVGLYDEVCWLEYSYFYILMFSSKILWGIPTSPAGSGNFVRSSLPAHIASVWRLSLVDSTLMY